MALTFPRHMTIPKAWKVGAFSLKRFQEQSTLRNGDLWIKDLADPHWTATYVSKPVSMATKKAWMADLRSLEGGVKTGYFHAVEDGWLSAYSKNVAATHDYSSAVVSAIAGDFQSLSFTGLPANLQVAAGDLVTVATSVGIETYQFTESGTANGSGVLSTISVTPPVKSSVATSDEVTMYECYIEGVIIDDSLTVVKDDDNFYVISFQVMQRVR